MKRSEAIDKITLLLETQSRQGTAYRYKAYELLNFIEEQLKMLPPETDRTIEKHLCTVNEWDKEDLGYMNEDEWASDAYDYDPNDGME